MPSQAASSRRAVPSRGGQPAHAHASLHCGLARGPPARGLWTHRPSLGLFSPPRVCAQPPPCRVPCGPLATRGPGMPLPSPLPGSLQALSWPPPGPSSSSPSGLRSSFCSVSRGLPAVSSPLPPGVASPWRQALSVGLWVTACGPRCGAPSVGLGVSPWSTHFQPPLHPAWPGREGAGCTVQGDLAWHRDVLSLHPGLLGSLFRPLPPPEELHPVDAVCVCVRVRVDTVVIQRTSYGTIPGSRHPPRTVSLLRTSGKAGHREPPPILCLTLSSFQGGGLATALLI